MIADAVTRLLDLGQDVRRQENGPALGLGLADDAVEYLLDERVQARRRLVEEQQVGPVLEGDDQPDLLLVALRVLAELARRVHVQARDQVLLVRLVDAAAQVGEVLERLAAGEVVVQDELAGQVADAGDGSRPGRRSVSMPKIVARPLVGRIWSRRVRIIVVLPAPFGPRKPNASPSSTSRSTSMIPRCFP